MRNTTNRKRSSITIAIAAVALSMTLGAAPASAASQLAGSAVHADVDGKGHKGNNGQAKGNKHRLELPISWLHHVLGSVGLGLRSVTTAER